MPAPAAGPDQTRHRSGAGVVVAAGGLVLREDGVAHGEGVGPKIDAAEAGKDPGAEA